MVGLKLKMLNPRLIICFGKKAYDFLIKLYDNPIAPIKYILHPSGQYTQQHPEKQTVLVNEIAQILNSKKKGKKSSNIHSRNKFRKIFAPSKKNKSRKGGNDMSNESIITTREKMKKYLIGLGFQETNTESFDWSAKHPALGIINFTDMGKNLGSNLLSGNMRKNCGCSRAEIKKLKNEEREVIYKKYFESKPYYDDIKYGVKFHPRASGTDYVSLSFHLGFEPLRKAMDYEFKLKK